MNIVIDYRLWVKFVMTSVDYQRLKTINQTNSVSYEIIIQVICISYRYIPLTAPNCSNTVTLFTCFNEK